MARGGRRITAKMRWVINVIQKETGDRLYSKDYDKARQFIDDHAHVLDCVDKRKYLKPTDKMLKAADFCRRATGIAFSGSTMLECSHYLDTYLPQATSMVRAEAGDR